MSRTFETATPLISSASAFAKDTTATFVSVSVASAIAGAASLVGALWLAAHAASSSSVAESWRAPTEITCKANTAHTMAACPECTAVHWISPPCRASNGLRQPAL
ncbi:MAG: hypothetical protein U1E60_30590 [Reyranellaceae bacterium]